MMNRHPEVEKKLLDRVSFFSDAVYAIVLTLLVLEIRIPELHISSSPSEMIHALENLLPKFYAFFLSVALVGGNWKSTLDFSRIMNGVTPRHVIYNIFTLAIVSLTPFVCALVGNYPDNPISFVVFGGLNIILVIIGILWMNSGIRENLYHPDTDFTELKKLQRSLPFLVIFIALLSASAFLSTTLSFILLLIWCLVPFFVTLRLQTKPKD